MDEKSADPRGGAPVPLPGDFILQIGIFCCVVTIVVALAVALAAS